MNAGAQLTHVFLQILRVTSIPILQDGGFYSAEDADSFPAADSEHKKEGAFCVWTKEEITSIVSDPLPNDSSKTLADLFSFHYDIQKEGNVNPYQVSGCGLSPSQSLSSKHLPTRLLT